MTAPVREGTILAGKYRVERVLGAGGMGVVVAANHVQLEEQVAIKFLLPDALENAETVARFGREARAAVKIKSEHVARIIDVGTLDSGAPYMVMEYLEGMDLAQWIAERGPLSISNAVDFVLQAGEAIAEAHTLGIVHRDLKPSNLFVARRPDGGTSIKVLDFGISKIVGPHGLVGDLTRSSAVMGSPLYMSPEQLRSSKDADARSDIWSLAVIFFELVTGRLPFAAESLPELVHQITAGDAIALGGLVPGTPAALQRALAKAFQKDRELRFQTVEELCVELLPFGSRRSRISAERISGVLRAAGMSGTSLTVPPSSNPHPLGGTTNGGWGSRAKQLPGSKAALVALSTLAVIGLIAITTRKSAVPPAALNVSAAPSDIRVLARATIPTPVAPPSMPPTLTAQSGGAVVTPASDAPIQLSALPLEPRTAVPVAKHAAAQKSQGAAPAANACNPPFTLDARGIKRLKPGCI
jgi:serine/threonine-protein kinase